MLIDHKKLKNRMQLLALAFPPGSRKSIRDWCPFQDNIPLWNIIKSYNDICLEGYEALDFLPEEIEEYAEIIDIVHYHLGTVNDLRKEQYVNKILIILIDLEAVKKLIGSQDMADIQAIDKVTELRNVKNRIEGYKPYLCQVSQEDLPNSLYETYFKGKVVPSDPVIIKSNNQFIGWLGMRLCRTFRKALLAAYKEKPGEGPAAVTYGKLLPRIASRVRDFVLDNGLSEQHAGILARQVGIQEAVLTEVAQQFLTPMSDRVMVDAIRQKIETMNISDSDFVWKPVNLMKVRLVRPLNELTPEQRHLVSDMGLKGRTYPSIHFAEPTVQSMVKQLEGVVHTRSFCVKMPDLVGDVKGKGSL